MHQPVEANDLLSAAARRFDEFVPESFSAELTPPVAVDSPGHKPTPAIELLERFEIALHDVEALGEWSTARATPDRTVIGELGGIATGIRHLRRTAPVEVERIRIGPATVRVPTVAEVLRLAGWGLLSRNRGRDYVAIGRVADMAGRGAVSALAGMSSFYDEPYGRECAIETQLVRQLADPRPATRRRRASKMSRVGTTSWAHSVGWRLRSWMQWVPVGR